MPWETASVGRDDVFRTLEASDIVAETTTSLRPIDDLAVVVLFSVFESQVRDYLAARIKPEAAGLSDPIRKGRPRTPFRASRKGAFTGGCCPP